MFITKVPSSLGGLGKANGTEKAPKKILEALEKLYLSEEGNSFFAKKESAETIKGNLEETQEKIYQTAKKVFENQEKSFFLGGDHSITYSIFKAFSEEYKNPGLLILDAHPDLMQSFKPATQENFLRVLIEERLLDPKNVVIVGLRNWDKEELNFLKMEGIRFFTMKEISFEGIKEVCDAMMSASRSCSNLYVSIDIDVVDPAFAPGTGYCEPGGLTSRELLYLLHRIKKLKHIKAIDLVEINPDKDSHNMTSILGAKILMELEHF